MHRFWLTVLTFAIVGPPIGLAVLAGWIMLDGPSLLLLIHLDVILLAAYAIGLLPASIAGAVVAGLEKPGFWQASRVGLVVGLVLALVLAITQLSRLPHADAVGILLLFAVPVSICVLPTMVCWLVVRCWVRRVPASDGASHAD